MLPGVHIKYSSLKHDLHHQCAQVCPPCDKNALIRGTKITTYNAKGNLKPDFNSKELLTPQSAPTNANTLAFYPPSQQLHFYSVFNE